MLWFCYLCTNFIVGIYTVLPFLPVFVYKDTAVLLVLAFFTVQLKCNYSEITTFCCCLLKRVSTGSGKSGKQARSRL